MVTALSMNALNNKTDFSTLLTPADSKLLLQRLTTLTDNREKKPNGLSALDTEQLEIFKNEWQMLSIIKTDDNAQDSTDNQERAATDWLIKLFNNLFAYQQVVLTRGTGEPEYFPAQDNKPARIEFAHGFFASALHELHTPLCRLTY